MYSKQALLFGLHWDLYQSYVTALLKLKITVWLSLGIKNMCVSGYIYKTIRVGRSFLFV